MLIAVGRIILDFYNNEKVATKTRNIEDLCNDIRRKFNISILEVADFDEPERCVIGFAAVIPENWKTKTAQSFLDKITETIDTTAFARVTVEDTDLLQHGGQHTD